jgi:hypothetical protein
MSNNNTFKYNDDLTFFHVSGYAVGHIMNDLGASFFFNYLV